MIYQSVPVYAFRLRLAHGVMTLSHIFRFLSGELSTGPVILGQAKQGEHLASLPFPQKYFDLFREDLRFWPAHAVAKLQRGRNFHLPTPDQGVDRVHRRACLKGPLSKDSSRTITLSDRSDKTV